MTKKDQVPDHGLSGANALMALLGLAIASFCDRLSAATDQPPHGLAMIGGALSAFLGFFAIGLMLLRFSGRQSALRAGLALVGLTALAWIGMKWLDLFSKGVYEGPRWLPIAALASAGCLSWFMAKGLGYLDQKAETPRPLPWGSAIALGLFALPFLLWFAREPAISLGLAIRHFTPWKSAVLPVLFIMDGVSAALVGYAFTWASPSRWTAIALPACSLAQGLVTSMLVLRIPLPWLLQHPGMFLTIPSGMLIGGWQALRHLNRRRAHASSPGEAENPA